MNEQLKKQRLAEATALVSRHLGLEVTAATIHGSILRGFNDPNSDTDICFLLNRPVSDYLNMSNAPIFEGTLDDRRDKLAKLSTQMSRELGWQIMVSLLDMRSLLRGIMNASTFSLMAYERFAADNAQVRFLFEDIAQDYFLLPNLVHRCGEHITNGMRTLQAIDDHGREYKQERTYLGTLWSAHRMLAYLDGDKQHCRTIQELIEMNRANWATSMSEGFLREVTGVIRARTERSPFDMPQGINENAVSLLRQFTGRVLRLATDYLREHPKQYPNLPEETREMIDLYQELLDHEDERNGKSKAETPPTELLAA
jgi:predicted nucleotidyltransferase